MTSVNPKSKKGHEIVLPETVVQTPLQVAAGPAVDRYVSLGGVFANSDTLPVLPTDVGLFKKNPFPLRLMDSGKKNTLNINVIETPFTRLTDYLSPAPQDNKSRTETEKLKRKYPYYAPLIARVMVARELGDLYVHVLKDICRNLDLFSQGKKEKFAAAATAFSFKSATAEEIRVFILNTLGELVPYGPTLARLIEHQKARVRVDPEAVLELLDPIMTGESRHFESHGDNVRMSYLDVVRHLCGVQYLQPIGKINRYSLLTGDDALKLLFLHGPKPYLVMSVLTHFDSKKNLPDFLDKNLSDDMKRWVSSLDEKSATLALILVITAHVSRSQKLATVLRQLAMSGHHENIETILKNQLSALTPELAALSENGLEQWILQDQQFVPDAFKFDIYQHLLFLHGGYKPSALISLRQLLNPDNAMRLIELACHLPRLSDAKVNMARRFLNKHNWPVAARLMGAELVLFFAGDPSLLEKLSLISRHDQTDELGDLIQLYRSNRLDGNYVVDNFERLKGPLKLVTPVLPVTKPQKMEWKNKDIKTLLYRLGVRFGKIKDDFEKLCKAVFDSGEFTVTQIQNLLEKISGNPDGVKEVETLMRQNPQFLEEKKQGLSNLANWELNALIRKTGIESEPFTPLRDYLIHTMETHFASGNTTVISEVLETALRVPQGSYLSGVLTGTPHQDLMDEAEARLKIFLQDEYNAGLDWLGILGGHWRGYAGLMEGMPESMKAKHARRLSREPAVQWVDLLTGQKLLRFKNQLDRELSGKDSGRVSFIKNILTNHIHSPLDVLGFMYWLIGLPHTNNGPDFQNKIVSDMTLYRDYLKARSAQVFGPVLSTFLDRNHHAWEEITATLFHLQEGDHIHFLPPVLKRGYPTPNLMSISKTGEVTLIEVKKLGWSSQLPYDRLRARLSLVNKQLGALMGGNQEVRRVAHFRVYLRRWDEKELFLSEIDRCLQNGFYRNIDEIILMMSPLEFATDQTMHETEVVRVNLREPSQQPKKEGRYGADHAQRLSQLMLREGHLGFQDYPVLKALAALKTSDELTPLTQDDLMTEVSEISSDETTIDASPEEFFPNRSVTFENLAPFMVPISSTYLAPLLGVPL